MAYWRDAEGRKFGRTLGPAHVRDTGRRTARGAIIWRAGDGPLPTPQHLTPRDAEDRLDAILHKLAAEERKPAAGNWTLRDATQRWVAERKVDKDLKRSTLAGYELMFERLYRDLGADTRLTEFEDGRLQAYFQDFKSYRVVNAKTAERARTQGKSVEHRKVERWAARQAGSDPIEVATKQEAVQLADELPGTWAHLRRGVYRVLPLDAPRTKTMTSAEARALKERGWDVQRRTRLLWMIVSPAAAQTRNQYRDILGACFNYAVRQHWITHNPLAQVRRISKRADRERVLRREDFYNPQEVQRLLAHAATEFEEAFWLCGAHAGLRLPGEALGLKWGAVDFHAKLIRPYDNWVRGAPDTTKTGDAHPIPMTPQLAAALQRLRERGYATGDGDYVFATALQPDKPAADKPLREAFQAARQAAGLKPIKMYNLRHSFGTTLAANNINIRTIQALMRHTRITTTEQYLAYQPQPHLNAQITRALEPAARDVDPVATATALS
ncbi:MAG TPA: site-specific integrase [Solirubrobacteraceae bacterium]|nr:site-specific integrase [Solirubrobacteraceae bacterium]